MITMQCNVDILHGSSGQSGHYKWKEIYILSGPTKKWLLSSNSKLIRNYYSQFPVLFVKLIRILLSSHYFAIFFDLKSAV